MGLFSGITKAKVGQGGVYFVANRGPGHTPETPAWEPAQYRVQIKKIEVINSRKGDDLFIVEAKVLESDCPERKAGVSASWVVNLKQDAALGNIKGFIAAANGIDPGSEEEVNEAVTEEVCELVVGKDQPLADDEVLLTCVMIKTKAGNDFTLHQWKPVNEG